MRKKCKRKIYRLVNPIEHAIYGASLLNAGQIDHEQQEERDAIEAFRTGTATLHHFHILIVMLNVAEHMAHNGIGPEVMPVAAQAHDHLVEVARRMERTGKLGMTGPALQNMRELQEWHYLQRTAITGREYKQQVNLVKAEIKGGSPKVVVL